jgi:putative hemolysin
VTGLQIALLAVLVACIGASGFFSGSETAIVALPRERASRLREQGVRGSRLADLMEDLEATFGTLLVANNFVNILGASVATTLMIDLIAAFGDRSTAEAAGPWASTVVVTAVILVVGEITPKTLAARRPEQFAMFVAPTIWWLGRIIDPVARVFVGLSRRILRLIGVTSAIQSAATEEDIMALALLSEEEGHIEPEERQILEALFDLADRPVREVMTPRLEVIGIELGATEQEARRLVATHGHSRFPVVPPGGTLDDIVGILYMKDVLTERGSHHLIDRHLREPVFIPESTPVLFALHRLRRQAISFGVVLDEHGGVDGIVTVKDLIAELIGEIQDEYDPKEPATSKVGEGVWVVEGRVPVEDLSEEMDIDLPEGPYASVGGLYLWAAGRIPEVGDRVEVESIEMTVLRMDRQRIDRLRVEFHGRDDAETR